MTIIARDLSNACGLAIYADRIWTGSGCIGLGLVFMGISMGDNLRTPEDDQKLKKLEQALAELKLMTTTKLEILCSSSFRRHLEEPLHRHLLPTPKPIGAEEIFRLTEYWREEHKRRGQSKQGKEESCLPL